MQQAFVLYSNVDSFDGSEPIFREHFINSTIFRSKVRSCERRICSLVARCCLCTHLFSPSQESIDPSKSFRKGNTKLGVSRNERHSYGEKLESIVSCFGLPP